MKVFIRAIIKKCSPSMYSSSTPKVSNSLGNSVHRGLEKGKKYLLQHHYMFYYNSITYIFSFIAIQRKLEKTNKIFI